MDKNLHESGLSEFSCLFRELDSLELVNPIQTGGGGGEETTSGEFNYSLLLDICS